MATLKSRYRSRAWMARIRAMRGKRAQKGRQRVSASQPISPGPHRRGKRHTPSTAPAPAGFIYGADSSVVSAVRYGARPLLGAALRIARKVFERERDDLGIAYDLLRPGTKHPADRLLK